MTAEIWAPLRDRGLFAAVDVELARALGRLAEERRPEVLLAVALASRQTREGHVCVELERFAGAAVLDLEGQPIAERRWPELSAWRAALGQSALVGAGPGLAPLVLDASSRLYLARYFEHERRLAELLLARNGPVLEPVDRAALADGLARLFGEPGPEPDGQRRAAEVALTRRLAVVSGGPGTGKTSTVVKILALLVEDARARGCPDPRVALLAPTGKAAARLGEAIARAKATLAAAPEVLAAIPDAPSTIHRELGARGSGGTRFARGPDSPLLADVVVVDESSMVDVALMRRLLEAVPEPARLVMLGDEHQLASVEAGAVLGDVCRAAAPDGDGIAASIVRLSKSYRFSAASGIGRLARAIHAGDADQVMALLLAGGETVLEQASSAEALGCSLAAAARAGFSPYLRETDAERALGALERFRVLCAHRRGREGVVNVNALVERALADDGLLAPGGRAGARWYPGRPLLVTHNDYSLGLFNGDVGIIWQTAEGLRAFFRSSEGPRWLSPSRLPPHETVFATSIHKSQGSEFDEVAVVLPDCRSPLLTRELFYTAVTRARRRVVVYGTEAGVRAAVERRIQRATGLTDALRGRA